MKLRNGLTIGGLLRETVAKYGERPAVTYMSEQYSYSQLDNVTDRLTAGFLKIGIGKGTRAGIWAGDKPGTLFVFFALAKLGAIPVMFNASWNPKEMRSQAEFTQIETMFFDEGQKDVDFVSCMRAPETEFIKNKIYIGRKPVSGFVCLKDLETDEIPMFPEVSDADTGMIIFTSGTTSDPKGVETSHYSIVNIGAAQAEMISAACSDVICVAIPIFHCFSMGGNVMAAISCGACICFPENRRTDSIYRAIQERGCTVFTAVPTLFSAMLANKNSDNYDVSSLRIGLVGGAPCPARLMLAVQEKLGMLLLSSLGQSEATAAITCSLPTDTLKERSETVGYIIEHVESRIVDIRSGKILDPGKNGELCIRGYNVMKGYYNRPDLTAAAIDPDGFLHTGDMGFFDEKGLLHLTGRLKELIIRGGENIAPIELEEVISGLPGVSKVKVIGVPDDHYGEEICACVELEECFESGVTASGVTEETVREAVRSRLAYYKVPKYVVFLKKIPLLFNGKIDVGAVKKLAEEELGAE